MFKKIATFALSLLLIFGTAIPVLATQTSVADLKIQLRHEWPDWVVCNTMYPQYKVFNTGNVSINLSDITIKYYFNRDKIENMNFYCDWIGDNNSLQSYVTAEFHKLEARASGVDTYVVIGFKSGAGSIEPGASTYLHTRITTQPEAWNPEFNQANDYSYKTDKSTRGTYTDWEMVTGYIKGELVWGIEPGMQLAKPENLSASVNDKVVTLTWEAVSGANGYKLYKSCEGEIIQAVPTDSASYVDKDVEYCKVYTYYVVAIKDGSESAKSNVVDAQIPTAAPKQLTASLENKSVVLKWLASSGAQSYNVLRAEAPNGEYGLIALLMTK